MKLIDLDVSLSEGTVEGESPRKPKSLNFPFYWIKISHVGKFHILEKKVSLTAFRYTLTKILPATCIQFHNYDLFENAQLKLSSLIQNRVQ